MIASIEATSSGAASWAADGLHRQLTERSARARPRIEIITNLSNYGQSSLNLSTEDEPSSLPNHDIHDYRPMIRGDGLVHQPLIQHLETVLRPEQHEIDLPDWLK